MSNFAVVMAALLTSDHFKYWFGSEFFAIGLGSYIGVSIRLSIIVGIINTRKIVSAEECAMPHEAFFDKHP